MKSTSDERRKTSRVFRFCEGSITKLDVSPTNSQMLKKLFAHANRGILLDLMVFFVNIILLTILSRQLANLFQQGNTYGLAKAAVALFCLGLAFLQPIGAVLKRRRAHLRKPGLDHVPFGRVFLPAYFLTQLLFLIAARGQIVDLLSSWIPVSETADYFGLPASLFTLLILGIPALAIANTLVFYFYFQSPRHKPLLKFLESPQAESLGDACLFLNMIGYQAFWGLLMADLTNDYGTITGRLSMFAFTSLLIYFPPRLFYLAEDGRRPVVWLTMLLANTPVLLRIIFVASAATG